MKEPAAPKAPVAKKKPPAKPKAKKPAKPKAKPDAGAPSVCSICGKKWARHGMGGLCSICAKAEDDVDLLPPLRPQDVPEDDDKPIPTPQEVKRGRIFEIAQLMASGEWRSPMAKALGKVWKLDKKTVQHYSAEASRLLDYTTGQREKLVNIARMRLLQVLHEDENDRVPAARTLLEHLGELRQNITMKPALDPFEGWSDEEITRFGDTGERPERLKLGRSGKK